MRLEDDIALLEKSGVSLLHFDIMDGNFVPQLTVGDGFVRAVKTTMLKDVHLMIADPLEKVQAYAAAGADLITIHAEAGKHLHRCLQLIGEMKNVNDEKRGIVRGLALNPSTPLAALEPLLDEIDVVFLIAINPGFPGQKFIQATRSRFLLVKDLLKQYKKDILIGIDGGVTRTTIADCAALGADIVVSGSGIFENRNVEDNFSYMLKVLRNN
jgi:ribulose-phosphate 3-epimerase